MRVDWILDPVLELPRSAKRLIAILVDAALAILAVWIAMYLRLGEFVPLSGQGWPAAIGALLLAVPIFAMTGVYRIVFRHIGWDAVATLLQAVVSYGLLYAAIFTAFGIEGVPRTVGVIQPIVLLVAIVGSRAFVRKLGRRSGRRTTDGPLSRTLIYGAGSAGRQLAAALADTHKHRVVGFIDDSRDLQGSTIDGLRVWDSTRLAQLIEAYDVKEVMLAIPSATRKRRNEIVAEVRHLGVMVKTLPGLMDIVSGKVSVANIRPLDIEDLLSRDPVPINPGRVEASVKDVSVLVTGAGGSIGSELCRQILAARPSQILLVENSEFNLYSIQRKLQNFAANDPSLASIEVVPLLASVCDESRMRRIFEVYKPATVYHAAAYKHVPLVEHNVIEGARNNILGTHVCAKLAAEFRSRTFVLISTDKAVRPTNVMGATKRVAEMLLQSLASQQPATCFCMVRFGNVLGSSGSVVPLFRQQISAGGPVTVTHHEITRFFMTIPEAAQLVLHAAAMAGGGEVFVLDMGEPVKVLKLAERMIELSGLQVRNDDHPEGDVEIVFTGLRPGEKLYEEVLIGNDPVCTEHPRIMKASEAFPQAERLRKDLIKLQDAIARHDVGPVRDLLRELVPEYAAAPQVVDWIAEQERLAGRAGPAQSQASPSNFQFDNGPLRL
jgi:FlaA1/EpsC-like NDP-sugar epimerase